MVEDSYNVGYNIRYIISNVIAILLSANILPRYAEPIYDCVTAGACT